MSYKSTYLALIFYQVSSDSDASPTEWLTEVVEVGDESVIVSLWGYKDYQ